MNPSMRTPRCRETVANLADWVDRPLDVAAVDPHLRSCGECARLVERARRTAQALRAIEPVAAPSVLSVEKALADVYDEVCEATGVGDLLRSALPPVPMPFDVPVAGELASGICAQRVSTLLERALPPSKGPAWVWGRVRADLRTWLSSQRSLRRRKVASWVAATLMTAAAVVVATRIAVEVWPPPQLRADRVIDSAIPFDASLSPASIMEEAARPAERK